MELILFTGGARSGKSTAAERLARQRGGDAVSYIATAEAFDDEMRERIRLHQEQRPSVWQTLEAPRDPAAALRRAQHPVVLLDCLTLLVSNHLLQGGEESAVAAIESLLAAWRDTGCTLIAVTNEVGWSIVPMNKLARQFRDLQGRVNRMVMEQASTGVLVVAGQQLVIKGSL